MKLREISYEKKEIAKVYKIFLVVILFLEILFHSARSLKPNRLKSMSSVYGIGHGPKTKYFECGQSLVQSDQLNMAVVFW